MTVRVRFAPSPTGNLHIGTLRAALFNWLYAKSTGGTFIVRIEDTDKLRSESRYEENIHEGLRWLGIVPDEGPGLDGDVGPYRQSERMEEGVYQKIADRLVQSGHAYYCFLSPEEIEAEKKSAKKAGIAYMHSRKSSEMSDDQVSSAIESGKPYAIRFKMTDDRIIPFLDQIRGTIDFDCALISDFVLMKSDGSPSYNFAVVVDDALMKITHVIRGEDHVSNMPRQLALYEVLGYKVPQFAHLPMILGPDKSKLSKRHGATAVTEYRDRGFLTASFMNYLALLGWSPKDETELLESSELIDQFGLERVHKSGAVFDIQKLMWMNGQYIRRYEGQDLFDLLWPYMSPEFQEKMSLLSPDKQVLTVGSVRDNLDVLSDINQYLDVYLESSDMYAEKACDVNFNEGQKEVLSAFVERLGNLSEQASSDEYMTCLEAVCEQLGVGKGKVFKPVRLAVTARPSGPFIADVLAFFGVKGLKERIGAYL